MASTENGATQLAAQPSEISSVVSGFDSDEYATTALTRIPTSVSLLSSFDSDDCGTTAQGTPVIYVPLVTYYKMRALDLSCAPSPPTYRTWVVVGAPDTDGSRYTGTHCGADVSFTDIVVADVWRQ